MFHKRRDAVVSVAEKLMEFEFALDQAIIAGAALSAEIPQARIRANLSAVVAQDAMDLIADAVAKLSAARSRTVAAHHEFAKVQGELGIREKMSGMLWKSANGQASQLELVAEAAA